MDPKKVELEVVPSISADLETFVVGEMPKRKVEIEFV
jgi:hypothetical protein